MQYQSKSQEVFSVQIDQLILKFMWKSKQSRWVLYKKEQRKDLPSLRIYREGVTGLCRRTGTQGRGTEQRAEPGPHRGGQHALTKRKRWFHGGKQPFQTMVAEQMDTHMVRMVPGFPAGSGKEPACKCRRLEFNPWLRKIPWRRKWQPTPIFLPGKSCGQRNLAGYSPWGLKSAERELATKQQQEWSLALV